ncbi:hypothetical protein ACFU5O_04610 [Streptomyces sp. NPDC057445]|uniref:hypothetical protein n=1 Tax=Streptomyces sp. NPDC057445 TaxID=3346136 RepID=UPI0036D14196
MHSDIHLHLHELRARELHREATTTRPRSVAPRRAVLRAQLGWALVSLGLRLVAAPRPRTAAA